MRLTDRSFGKTSVGWICQALGFLFLDTGVMYRAVLGRH